MRRFQMFVHLLMILVGFSTFVIAEDSNTGQLAKTPVVGASSAKVTIVEFTDFQCAHCKTAHFTLKELLKQYKGKIKIAYKHYPLDFHVWAKDAAIASVCVYKQEPVSFWKLTDYFFQNQGGITAETLSTRIKEFSGRSNLNYSQLQSCMQDPSTKEKVSADIAEAGRLGLNATPSFVVNGKIVQGALPIEEFKAIIDQALAEVQ
jgi:protein-disulfide isomerase